MATVNPIQLQKFLKGVNYPASKDDIIQQAEKNGADSNALDALKQMKDGTYNKPTDVSEAIGEQE